eukprot:274522_1
MATSQPKILHLRKKRHSKEYYRRATFLTACMNFKSCEENAMLLLYGYTREKTKNISLYKYIPDDLMHLIYTICYKEKKFYEGNNHNHWDEKSIDKLNKLTEHEGYTKMELNDSKDIIKIYSNDNSLQTIVATNRITNSRIRKVWRLKILETSNKNINENINENIIDTEMNDISKFVGNKNIRKRPNKKNNKNRNNNMNNDNERVRFDRYESHNSAFEPAPKLSSDQRLPTTFGVNDNKNENIENDKLNFSRKCYVCKKLFCRQHFFYDSMCIDCGDYNFYQRFDCYSCENKVAIVTGARIKIGYEIALKLLRSKCFVIVTTRFPRYAAIKYAKEKDFKSWQNKLCILGLDFCRLNSVDKFIKYIKSKFKHIDILINNAATTVRRTPEFYKDIIEIEKKKLPANIPKNLVIQYEHFTDSHQVAPP